MVKSAGVDHLEWRRAAFRCCNASRGLFRYLQVQRSTSIKMAHNVCAGAGVAACKLVSKHCQQANHSLLQHALAVRQAAINSSRTAASRCTGCPRCLACCCSTTGCCLCCCHILVSFLELSSTPQHAQELHQHRVVGWLAVKQLLKVRHS